MIPLLLLACTDTAFHVRREGADLPVWLEGDPGSEVFVVVQHGSAASGAVYDHQPAFDTLEERYAFVYWEQRAAGMSQGNPADDTVGMASSVADLDLVLAAVDERWSPTSVVLLGHSLGGGLSQSLLRRSTAGVLGYVDVSGGRSLPEAWGQVRERMLARCGEEGWADCTTFYADRLSFPRAEPERSTHVALVDRVLAADGYDQPAATAAMTAHLAGRGLRDTLFAGFDVLALQVASARFTSVFDLDAGALTPADVAGIDLPTLFVAGRHDLAVPVAQSRASLAAFGVNDPRSRLVVLDGGHFPMWDDPVGFSEAVDGFLDDL